MNLKLAAPVAFFACLTLLGGRRDFISHSGMYGGDESALLGDWHGTSLCLVKPSACHDEEALYHVKALPQQSGKFSLQADKIVDGKPVVMGTADCSYDAPKRLLRCDFPKGYIELTLQNDHLDGSMFLPDKTRWREIKLTKARP